MPQVPPLRTPTPDSSLIPAAQQAYLAELGHLPANEVLACILGQFAFECRHGSACMNFNVGCYKRGVGPDWTSFETTEWLGDPPVEHSMICEFSAWPTLEDALAFTIASLYQHFPEAWSAAVAGDSDAFVAGLKKRDYFTGPLLAYQAGVRKWRDFYVALLAGDERVTEPALDDLPAPAALAVEATTGLLDGDGPDSAA
jgi:hypothetical protein